MTGIDVPNTMTFSFSGNGDKPKPTERSRINKELFGEDDYLLPHSRTFSGIVNTISRVYSFRFDEAMRHAPANAITMRHDPYFAALIQERITPLSRWEWQIEIDDDDKKGAGDKGEEIRQSLESIVRATWAFDHMREYLGEFVWPGRYGSQVVWGDATIGGKRRKAITHHRPVDGDKILTDFDGCPAVAIYPADIAKFSADSVRTVTLPAGAKPVKGVDGKGQVAYTDRFPVLKLDRPDYRQRFIIPIFKMRDGDYYDPYSAGMVGGIGLRHYAYWGWWLRDEMLAWATDFMEKVGSLGIMLFFYDESNPAQKANAIASAKSVGNGNALACPVPRGDQRAGGVELLPANLSGVQFLTQFIGDYFEGHIERLIVGQKMSADHTGSGGLGGSGAASFAMDTKYQLLASDATLMQWAYTQDLVKPALAFNFPGCPWRYHFKLVVPAPDSDKKLENVSKAFSMGVDFAEDDVRELTGVPKPGEDVKTLRQIQQEQQQGQMQSDAIKHPTSMKYAPELVGAMLKTSDDPKATAKLSALANDPDQLESVAGDGKGIQSPPDTDGIPENGGTTAHYAWVPGTSRGGKVKAVGVAEHEGRTLYGEDAERALRGKPTAAGPDAPSGQVGKAPKSADEAESGKADKHVSASRALGILDNPHLATAEDIGALAGHLKNASAKDVRQLSQRFFRDNKGLKGDVIGKLVAYAKGTRAAAGVVDEQPTVPGGTVESGSKSGPKRNWRAGSNAGEIQFPSEDHQQLYDIGANDAYSMRGGKNKTGDRNVKDHSATIAALAKKHGKSEDDIRKMARDVHKDVKSQMSGLADGESRTVKDNHLTKHAASDAESADEFAHPAGGHAVHEHFRSALAASDHLSDGQRAHYGRSIDKALSAMPTAAHDLIAKNVKDVNFHADPAAVGHGVIESLQAAPDATLEGSKRLSAFARALKDGKVKPGAAWVPKHGGAHLDGDLGEHYQAHEVYAHSLGHAIDGPEKNISKSRDWQAAWEEEIAPGGLSKYAGKSAHEGFAEFCRLVYGADNDPKSMEAIFPKASAAMQARGLWPESKAGEDTDVEEPTPVEASNKTHNDLTTTSQNSQRPHNAEEPSLEEASVSQPAPTGGNILPEVFAERVPLDDTQDGAHVDAVSPVAPPEPEAKPSTQANPDHLAALAAIPAGKTGMVNGHEVLSGGNGIYSMTRDGKRFVGVDKEIAAAVQSGHGTEVIKNAASPGGGEALGHDRPASDDGGMGDARRDENEDADSGNLRQSKHGSGSELLGQDDSVVDEPAVEPEEPEDPATVKHEKAIRALKNKVAAWNRKHSLANEVVAQGGIDPTSIKGDGGVRALQERGIHPRVFRGSKTALGGSKLPGQGADVLAESLHNHGHIRTPEHLNHEDHLLDQLASGAVSLNAPFHERAELEHEIYQRELAHALSTASPEDVASAVRSGTEQGAHVAQTTPEATHAGEAEDVGGQVDEPQGDGEEVAGDEPTAEADDSFDFGFASPEHGELAAQLDEHFPQAEEQPTANADWDKVEPAGRDHFENNIVQPMRDTVSHFEDVAKRSGRTRAWNSFTNAGMKPLTTPDTSAWESAAKEEGHDPAALLSGHGEYQSLKKQIEDFNAHGERDERDDEPQASPTDDAPEDLSPGRARDLFGAPVFRSKKGTQLSLNELAREVWPDKAKEWAEAQGKTVDQITAGGRFRVGDKWYTIGNAETGYKVDEADAPKVGTKVEMVRAPAGGKVSEVDGIFYPGGQLMPIHGLSVKSEPTGTGTSEGGPVEANEDAKAKSPREPRREMSPDDIERENDRKRAEEMQDGPLGQLYKFNPHTGMPRQTIAAGFSPWKEFANQVGEEKLKKIVSAFPPPTDPAERDDYDYQFEHPQDFKANQTKKHAAVLPSSAAARYALGHAISQAKSSEDMHAIHQRVKELLSDNPDADLVEVQPATAGKPGEAIPPEPKQPHEMTREEFHKQRETETVGARKAALAAVMADVDNLDTGKPLPVGISKAQWLETLGRKTPEQKTLLAKLNVARKNAAMSFDGERGTSDAVHKRMVESAHAAGKPVPAAVLKDYPELQGKVDEQSTDDAVSDEPDHHSGDTLFGESGTDEAAGVTDEDTPRTAAVKRAKQLDDAYAFARQSSVGNIGEDLQGSARHRHNEWRGLADAEANGTAAAMMTRENLLKAEPHSLMSTIKPHNALPHLAAHLALNAFPAKPFEPGEFEKYHKKTGEMHTANSDMPKPKTEEELRKQYFDAYQAVKSEAEKAANEEVDPGAALKRISKVASELVDKYREKKPNRYGATVEHDRYNPVANALIDLYKRTRVPQYGKPGANDAMGRILKFGGHIKQKYGDNLPPDALESVSQHVQDVMEGHSFNKTFGVSADASGRKQFDPSELYVKHASRKGGRVVDAATVENGKKYVTEKLGMRGLQWGNYVTDDERQHHLTKSSEALSDLADVTGLPEEAMSLGGVIGLSIGARGHGRALATYHPDHKVINLTRTGGVGALAHEWGHALDHLLGGGGADRDGGKYLSDELSPQRFEKDEKGGYKLDDKGKMVTKDKSTDPEWAAMNEVRKAMGTSGFNARLSGVVSDMIRAGDMSKEKSKYWTSHIEKFARLFETFVTHKLENDGRENTYLTGLAGGHPLWPTKDEVAAIAPAVEKLLAAVKPRFQKPGDATPAASEPTGPEPIANLQDMTMDELHKAKDSAVVERKQKYQKMADENKEKLSAAQAKLRRSKEGTDGYKATKALVEQLTTESDRIANEWNDGSWRKSHPAYQEYERRLSARTTTAPYDHPAAIASAVASSPSGMPALDEMRKAYALHHTEINRHLGKQAAEKEGREVAREADPKKLLAIMEHERGMHENRDFIHEPHYRPLVNHIKALRSLTGIKDEPEPVKPTGEHTRVKPDQANHTSLGTDHQHWHTISVPAGKHRVTIRGTNDPTKPAYLARLTGTDPRWQFKREFVRPMPTLGKDDHHGVDLGDGVYEARTGDASGKLDQRLFKVTDGKLTHLHLSNVGAHLPIDTGPSKPWDEEKDGPVPFQATDTVKTWSV